MAAPAEAPVQIDPAFEGDESDSAYNSEVASYTTSLTESASNYKFENGRRYHSFQEGKYVFPNDEKEMDRLDIFHNLTRVALQDKLFSAPVKDPKRVLDLGTGTGIWAIEFGDSYPNSEVIGNDLSPIQPRWTPPNVQFEVDDFEKPWTYQKKFDFIHSRCLYGCVKNWPDLVSQVFEFTAPGGCAEFTDLDLEWRSPDGTHKGTSAETLNLGALSFLKNLGMEPSPGKHLEEWVKAAGFEDVKVQKMPLPIGTWPADKRLKQIGAWNLIQTTEGLESFFLAPLTRGGAYMKDEVEVMCADARNLFKDRKFHVYFDMYNVWGKKPLS